MTNIKSIYRKLTYAESAVKRSLYYDSESGLIHSSHPASSRSCSYIASPTIMARKQKRAVKYKPIENK